MPTSAQGRVGGTSTGRLISSKLGRTVVVAVDGVLAVGTGAMAGLFGSATAAAAAPTPGWSGQPGATPEQSRRAGCQSRRDCLRRVLLLSPAVRGCRLLRRRRIQQPQLLIETHVGGAWSAIEAPLPANAAPGGRSELFGVSCPIDSICVAVGTATDNAGGTGAVIETLTGGAWHADAPLPSDALTGSARARPSSRWTAGGRTIAPRWAPPAGRPSWRVSRARPWAGARRLDSSRHPYPSCIPSCSPRVRAGPGRPRTRHCLPTQTRARTGST